MDRHKLRIKSHKMAQTDHNDVDISYSHLPLSKYNTVEFSDRLGSKLAISGAMY